MHKFTHNFVSDVIVYSVEGVESDVRQPDNMYAERYFSREIWFKVFLDIDTDGHFGKYIATVSSVGWGGGLDDARDRGHSYLMRQQLQARVLEAIVESGKDGKRVALGVCPSGVRLE